MGMDFHAQKGHLSERYIYMSKQLLIRGNLLKQAGSHARGARSPHLMRLNSLLTSLWLCVFSFPFSVEAATVEGSVRVMKKEGVTVEVFVDGSSIDIQKGSILKQGSQIRTGKDGVVDLLFDNGAVLEITPNTDFLIKKFEREAFDPSNVDYKGMTSEPTRSVTKLKVDTGAVLVGVKKLKSNSEFNVSTPVGTAGIRGTSFFVKSDNKKRGGAIVGVTEGQVEVLTSGGANLPIRAGEAYGISDNEGGSTIKRDPAGSRELMAETRGIDRKIRSSASAKSFWGAPAKPSGFLSFFSWGKKSQPSVATKIIPKPTTNRSAQDNATKRKRPVLTNKSKPGSHSQTAPSDPLPPVENKTTDSATTNFSDTESSQDFFKGAGDAPVGEAVVGSFFDPSFRPATPPAQPASSTSNSGN